jgi:hypothetical protein
MLSIHRSQALCVLPPSRHRCGSAIALVFTFLLAARVQANNDGNGTWLAAPDNGNWEAAGNTTNWSNGKNKNPGDNTGTTTNQNVATFLTSNVDGSAELLVNGYQLSVKRKKISKIKIK